MGMASVTVRVDKQTKDEAAAIVESLGLDLSSVTRAFCRQIVRERRIPLSLSCDEANKDSLEALRESDEMARRGAPTFASARDMFDDMGVM